jgi:hypothetical protein
MSNILKFQGETIPGWVLGFAPGPFDLHPYETHFAGLDGVSRISGGKGRRIIEIPFVLFDDYGSRQELHDFINDTLNGDWLDANDTLEYRGTSPAFVAPYPDCTFEGFTPADPPGELFDEGDTLDGGWFCLGTLRFVQLSKDG